MKKIALALLATTTLMPLAEAKITRIEIIKEEPAFNGQAFGSVGAYVRIKARAYGELAPNAFHNKIIQDISLAPKNKMGRVEYVTDLDILRPVALEKGNKTLLVEVHNRGRKLIFGNFNIGTPPRQAEVNDLQHAGDGYLMKEGYTLVWHGWQADVLAGDNRLTLDVPVAKQKDGSLVKEIIRSEITVTKPSKTAPLAGGWWTDTAHKSFPPATLNNNPPTGHKPVLTVRKREQDPRVVIPNNEWKFESDSSLSLEKGFEVGKLYELTYEAKDPPINGIGLAVTRDIASFLKYEAKDNPVFQPNQKAIVLGTSQSGRMIRTFLHLGFNQDEAYRTAYDGAYPHIGGGGMSINIRFSQLGRAWGDQVDHLYPAYDFPFTYAPIYDPLTKRTQGVLDRCRHSGSCPKIFHVATALEVWEGRQSLGLTDTLGLNDVADPQNVRSFIFASTQHGSAPYSPTAPVASLQCQQQRNPNPQIHTQRALLRAFKEWVVNGKAPPDSQVPSIKAGTLVHPNAVQFPTIPANGYNGVTRPEMKLLRVYNPLTVLDWGKRYNPADSSGILTEPPKQGTASYGILVPQVDNDGNDIGGLKTVHVQAPIGTYTGWNMFKPEYFGGDGFCSLSGSFVPFAKTKAERVAIGDTRLSIEERYPKKSDYVNAVSTAADTLVKQRLLLPDDAEMLKKQAEDDGVRAGP